MDVLVTCKYEEDPIENEGLEWSQHFPHYNPMGAIRCHGHQSSDPIRLAHWLQRYSSLKMSTDTQPDTQTDDGSTGIL